MPFNAPLLARVRCRAARGLWAGEGVIREEIERRKERLRGSEVRRRRPMKQDYRGEFWDKIMREKILWRVISCLKIDYSILPEKDGVFRRGGLLSLGDETRKERGAKQDDPGSARRFIRSGVPFIRSFPQTPRAGRLSFPSLPGSPFLRACGCRRHSCAGRGPNSVYPVVLFRAS